MSTEAVNYQWTVVGGGPAGILAVGRLLDAGVSGKDIAWLDAHFAVGDFGRLWKNVPSNTTVALFLAFLNQFDCVKLSADSALLTMDTAGFCELGQVAVELQHFTAALMSQVTTQKGWVKAIDRVSVGWRVQADKFTFTSHKVIVAVGAAENSLALAPNAHRIGLEVALNPPLLAAELKPSDSVAVFGSSHSAILALKNVSDIGVSALHNIYQSPCRYAVKTEQGTLYDNTGLKGVAALWAKQNIDGTPPKNLARLRSDDKAVAAIIARCNKVIFAVGFTRRCEISVNGLPLSAVNYDERSGILGLGLFGLGIAFPQKVTDVWQRQEYSVGLWKFKCYLDTVLPIWQHYPA